MSETTIEWTRGPNGEPGKTWNPMRGCSLASDECKHCYAQSIARRFSGPGQPFEGLINKHGKWNGVMRRAPEHTLYQPLSWRKPTRVFVNSMTDLFHENASFEWIDRIFAVMALCPRHQFIVLTKRAERMREYMTFENFGRWGYIDGCARRIYQIRTGRDFPAGKALMGPLPNAILGVSVGRREFLHRIDDLRQTPAAVRMVSFEPLLEDLGTINLRGIGWCVAGGESGLGARPMHPAWARFLRDQCVAAGVPYFFKQWGAYLPSDQPEARGFGYDERSSHDWGDGIDSIHLHKSQAGRVLDGRTWDEMPR